MSWAGSYPDGFISFAAQRQSHVETFIGIYKQCRKAGILLEKPKQIFYQSFRGVVTYDAVLQITNTMPMQPCRYSHVVDHDRQAFSGSFWRETQIGGLGIPTTDHRDGRNRPFLQKIS
ncbi:hypothetical protein A1348_26090 [Pseudomonas protegens]|nr:hypothetical protein A1348_26090 [Pseudomonas protegens]